jgi:hypothetical protein
MLPRAHPHPFPGTRRMTLLVVALLAAHVVLAWLVVQAVFLFVELAWRSLAGRADYRALLASHVGQFRTLRTIQLVLWLATAAAFVRWVGRAQANLPILGATALQHSGREAMRAFIVPGYSLGRPLAVLRELWNASDPRYPTGMTWRAASVPARVRWWWALLLSAVAIELTVRGLSVRSGLAVDLGPMTQLLLLGELVSALAAVLGITIVLGVDNRQEAAAWRRTPEDPK